MVIRADRRLVGAALALALVGTACKKGESEKPAPSAPPAATGISVALVVDGWEQFVGNDRYAPADDPARTPGALAAIAGAVGAANLAAAAPAGSEATVISYGSGATVRMPLAPITTLDPGDLGDQQAYAKTVTQDLAAGVDAATAELAKSKAARKYLVVIGTGTDTDSAAAADKLARAKAALGSAGVKTTAFVYQPLEGGELVVDKLTDDVRREQTPETLGTDLGAYLKELAAAK